MLRLSVDRLARLYGRPKRPPADPWELILRENAAYLVDDAHRARVYRRLKQAIGITPQAILATPTARLAAVIAPDGGMRPPMRAAKLRVCAELALEIGLPHLRRLVRESPDQARRLLKRFPGVADPLAERILLFAGSRRSLAPDSNALRVLVRLGFGREEKDYGRTYRSVAAAVAPHLGTNITWVIAAHHLLRRHGQELCRVSTPRCEACPLTRACRWYAERR